MNIFILDDSPAVCAEYHADQHINKMLLESVQILSTVCASLGIRAPYKPTHARHPCTLWVAESASNARYLLSLCDWLARERRVRWPGCLISRTEIALDCIDRKRLDLALPYIGETPFVQAMPEECRHADPVYAYRRYYMTHKAVLAGRPARWTNRRTPYWFHP